MEKIDLLAIINKHIMGTHIPTDEQLIDIMSEVWNTAVDECKKAAITKCLNAPETTCSECEYHTIETYAIEQVKQMIL